MTESMNDDELTESRLREWGFRWEQGERQPTKHWLLWLAPACVEAGARRMFASTEDLGIEVASDPVSGWWYCWIRADYAGRYSRLVHVRHITTERDVVILIEALTGRAWNAADVMYGAFRSPEDAARLRAENERLDNRIAAQRLKSIDREQGNDTSKIGCVQQ